MTKQLDDETGQFFFLAQLETESDRWNSLHATFKEAELQLKAVGTAWDVGFTLDGEPADGFTFYSVERLQVRGPEHSGRAPQKSVTVSLTEENFATWMWLRDRGVSEGLSAAEMADDFGIARKVAAVRLSRLVGLGLAYEINPGRYRPGPKAA